MTAQKIRLAEIADIYDILLIEQQSFDITNDRNKTEILKAIKARKIHVLVNDIDVVGYIWVDINEKKRVAYIQSLAVGNAFRRKGCGEKLFSFVIDLINERDILKAALHVYTNNKGAIKLYQKYGFIKTDFIENRYGKNQNAYCMEREFYED
jgi:ribosomal protein S18 acetylase RimI-like enzyme